MTNEERARLYELAKVSECRECGRQMTIMMIDGEPALRCPENRGHVGYQPIRTLAQRYDDGEYINPYAAAAIEKRRRESMEEQGIPPGVQDEVKALTIYGGEGRYVMTSDIAMRAAQIMWRDKPREAVERALLICVQENLNPLRRNEIHIIHYKDKHGGPGTDEVVLGIEGNRKIAQRKTRYSYHQAPRPLTAQEMNSMGEDPGTKLGACVVLQTPEGSLYYGYGFIGREATIIGDDKGNSRWNMARIRALRQALSELVPDEQLPARVMLFDTMFADISTVEMPDLQVFPETAQDEPQQGSDLGDCPIHHKPFREGRYGPYCATKVDGGGYCKEKPKKTARSPKNVDRATGEIIDGQFREVRPEDLPDFDDAKAPESGTNVAKPNGHTKEPEGDIAGLVRALKDGGFLNEKGQVFTQRKDDYLKLLQDFGATKLSEITGEKIDTFKHRLADLALAQGV